MRLTFFWPFEPYTIWTDEAIDKLVGQKVPCRVEGEEILHTMTVLKAKRASLGIILTGDIIKGEK